MIWYESWSKSALQWKWELGDAQWLIRPKDDGEIMGSVQGLLKVDNATASGFQWKASVCRLLLPPVVWNTHNGIWNWESPWPWISMGIEWNQRTKAHLLHLVNENDDFINDLSSSLIQNINPHEWSAWNRDF